MKLKIIIGGVVVVVGIALAAVNFMNSTVEYGTFMRAKETGKRMQVKGEWVKEKGFSFDMQNVRCTFYMKDDNGDVERVMLDGAKPNNFDIAPSIVAKGMYMEDHFHATEILTKCPSKYQDTPVKQTSAM
jgi:cytochrome c-type biogenesis protein CcmE